MARSLNRPQWTDPPSHDQGMIGFARPWDRDLTFVLHTGSQAILPMPAPDPRPNITNAWWLTDPFTEAGGGRVRATATSAWSRPTAASRRSWPYTRGWRSTSAVSAMIP